MQLKTDINDLLGAVNTISKSATDLVHIVSRDDGLQLVTAAMTGGINVVVDGEFLESSSIEKTIATSILQLLSRSLSTWLTVSDPNTSAQILIDISEDTLEAFPLGSPTFALRLPLHQRIGPPAAASDWFGGTLLAITGDSLERMRTFWSRSSSKYPDREITHLEIKDGFLHVLSTDGNKMREHYVLVGDKGPFEAQVSNGFLNKLLSSSLAQEGVLEFHHNQQLLSLSNDGIEIITELQHLPELAQTSAGLERVPDELLAQVDGQQLRNVVRRIVSNKLEHVKLSLPQGEIQSVSSDNLQRRASVPGQLDEGRAVGISACVPVAQYAWDLPLSFTFAASSLLEAVKAIDADEDVRLWAIGGTTPDYIAFSGRDEFPRFILPLYI
jgi:hypothetical protein